MLMCSITAQAMERPSKVLVPRPISSRIRRLREVALRRMLATSVISTIKVLCPLARSSDAPTRVKIRSTTPIFALSAGTKLPICAISTISAVWRMYVDFPAMFGPVIMEIRFLWLSRYVSFGMNISFSIICSTTGWRPFRISMRPVSLILGRTKLFLCATSAREAKTSRAATAFAVRWIRTTSAPT